jgi:hypothetical protein
LVRASPRGTRRDAAGLLLAALALLTALLVGPQAHAAPGDTVLVNRASGPDGARGEGFSWWNTSISADGRFVAFASSARNLHPDAPRGGVFVRDVDQNVTMLASRASGADGESTSFAGGPSISADGRFVAFDAWGDLDPNAGEVFGAHIYVRDLQEDTTTLVSRASGIDGAPANRGAGAAAISADGRFVAFQSSATNLDPAATDRELPALTDVFRRELSTTPPPPVEEAYLPAKLAIERARMRRDGNLVVRGSLDPIAAGQRVLIRFRNLVRTIIVTADEHGRFEVQRLVRGGKPGRLEVSFGAFATLRAASQRLRAAHRPVRLRIAGANLRGSRLIVAGRVRPRARRHARVLVEFNRPDCSPDQIANRVKVNERGRFRLRRQVPPAIRDLGGRVSVIHPGRGPFYGQRRGRDVKR